MYAADLFHKISRALEVLTDKAAKVGNIHVNKVLDT